MIWDFLRYGRTRVYGKGEWVEDALKEGLVKSYEVTVPSCDGKPSQVTLHCPECGSSRLKEIPVWIHECGELVYEKATCPRCGDVSLEELTFLGVGYRCLDCNSIINFPEVRTECGDLNPSLVRVYELTEPGLNLMKEVRRIMDSIPGPKAEFVWFDGLPIEILVPPSTAYMLTDGSTIHEARAKLAKEMGFQVKLLQVKVKQKT